MQSEKLGPRPLGVFIVERQEVAEPPKEQAPKPDLRGVVLDSAEIARQIEARRDPEDIPVKILRPEEKQKGELAKSTAAFTLLIEGAIDHNAAYFLPQRPPMIMSRELSRFSARSEQFLQEAIALARELYPSRVDRDAAYSAIDRQASRLFKAVHGLGQVAPGLVGYCHWPTSPVMRARWQDEVKELEANMDAGQAKTWVQLAQEANAVSSDFWRSLAPVEDHAFAGARNEEPDRLKLGAFEFPQAGARDAFEILSITRDGRSVHDKDGNYGELHDAKITARVTVAEWDPRTGFLMPVKRELTFDFANPAPGQLHVDTAITDVFKRTATETWLDLAAGRIVRRDIAMRKLEDGPGYEKITLAEHQTKFDRQKVSAKTLPDDPFQWGGSNYFWSSSVWNASRPIDRDGDGPAPDFVWREPAPKLVFLDMCHGLDNLDAFRGKKKE